jgi:hypothetical protein
MIVMIIINRDFGKPQSGWRQFHPGNPFMRVTPHRTGGLYQAFYNGEKKLG